MYTEDKIFFAEATFEKVKNNILYVIGISIIIYCLFHFKENPIVISIIVLYLLYVVLLTGNNQVSVFPNRIEFVIDHPIKKLSFRRVFLFEDIDSIEVDLRLTKRGFILIEIMSSYLPGFSQWNTLKFKLKDGEEKTINTSVYKNGVIQALEAVKQIAKNKIHVKGI
jgi:hypothetical protein